MDGRVRTTDGSKVRGYELDVTTKPRDPALKSFLRKIGGDEGIRNARQTFEYRLVERGGRQFIQLREKTAFGKLKAKFSTPNKVRQEAEREKARALLAKLLPDHKAALRVATTGMSAPKSAGGPKAAAAPPVPVFDKAGTLKQAEAKTASPARELAAEPPRITTERSERAASASGSAAPVPPPIEGDSDLPPVMLVRKWEVVAGRKTPFEMHQSLEPKELAQKLAKGEMTEKTYHEVLRHKLDIGKLKQNEYALWKDHGLAELPDQSAITVDRQRALFVRDMAQAELFRDMKPRQLFGMVSEGKLSERAYASILKKKVSTGELSPSDREIWKNVHVDAERARKLEKIDVATQYRERERDKLIIDLYKNDTLQELSEKLYRKTLTPMLYEAILEKQHRRGLIDDTQLALWRNG
jgi:hypothetical protein